MASTSGRRKRSRRSGGSSEARLFDSSLKVFLFLVGGFAGCLFMYALANRPEMSELKARVEASLADYRRTHPRVPIREAHAPEAHADDWFIAAAYSVKLEGVGTFRCTGAVNVSVCTSPDGEKK